MQGKLKTAIQVFLAKSNTCHFTFTVNSYPAISFFMPPLKRNYKTIAQFEIRDQYIGILSSSMFVGMMFGAMFWGTLSDIYGRKQAFNFTLIVTSVFGIGAGFANSYWLLCFLILCLGFGVRVFSLCFQYSE